MFVTTLATMNRRSAKELFDQLEKVGIGWNIETQINRQLFQKGTAKPIKYLSQCASFQFLPSGGVTLREVPGFGEGVFVSKETLQNLHDHFNIMTASEEGTGSVAVRSSDGNMKPTRMKPFGESKREAMHQATEQRHKAKEATKKKEQERNLALAAVLPSSKAFRCKECRRNYRSQVRFAC